MFSKLRRFLPGLVAVFVVLAIITGFLGNGAVGQSFPQTSGKIKLAGLDGGVDVYRDRLGVAHIYAGSLHDLFMAQGYVHAQERFWQMDFWRHVGSGRLSEMLGKSQVDTDSFLRTLGWRQLAEQEWESLDRESQDFLNAYAGGVNAYLEHRSGTQLSLEYGILGLQTPSYQPEPWTPVHSLTWAKVMAWDLRGNISAEIERAILLKTLTPEQVDELFPAYPSDHPLIAPRVGTLGFAGQGTTALSGTRAPAAPALSAAPLAGLDARLALLDGILGRPDVGVGSNSLVVSGKLSASGKPILANDPHLGIQMPSIWYQVALHCMPRSASCSYDVAGFSFAGVPGVIIGHNERIAWGFTNAGPDVMDLYIEKINPDNPDQYEVNGEWQDMAIHTETLKVGGGAPVDVRVRVTRHGPIISDTFPALKDQVEPTATPFKDRAGIALPEHYAVALKWTALEPGNIFRAVWGFNKAENFNDFRQAARYFIVPAQNLLYADVDGNIGYQLPGNVPVRKQGDGRLPVPGWTDDYEWTGYIPFEELPYAYNPPEGFISTANNRIPPDDYPYLITADWDYGFRAARLVDLIKQGQPGSFDIATFQKIQGDDQNLIAAPLVSALGGVKARFDNANQANAYEMLTKWDGQNTLTSKEAAIFAALWSHLLKNTFHDDLPETYPPEGGDRWFEVVRNILEQPNSFWWDDRTTTERVETRDDILAKSFTDACDELKSRYGENPANWPAWGQVHTATFRNGTLGKSGIAPIEGLFNRGPFQVAGGKSIVNATAWDASKGYEVTNLPSMRMIVDLGDLDNSLTVHTTGQSGHAYAPHYDDMVDLWRNIQYYPMLWSYDTVIAAATEHLELAP